MRCPTCRKSFLAADSQALPFCSPRCRQVDLNRWLTEEHAVPNRSLEIEDDPEESAAIDRLAEGRQLDEDSDD